MRKLLALLILLTLLPLPASAVPNPGHSASEVGAGTFAEVGNYTFPGASRVGINISSPIAALDIRAYSTQGLYVIGNIYPITGVSTDTTATGYLGYSPGNVRIGVVGIGTTAGGYFSNPNGTSAYLATSSYGLDVNGIARISNGYLLIAPSTQPYGLIVNNSAIIDGSLGVGGSLPIAGIALSVGGNTQISGNLSADRIGVGTNPGNYRLNVNGPAYISGSLGLGASSAFRLTLPNSAGMDGSGLAYQWLTYSSKKWKTNIKKIDNALDKVLKLEGVEFDWKKEYGGKHDIGLIAEDVGKVVPEVVVYEDDSEENAVGLSYERLIPLLIEALKEQQKQINQLQLEINALKNTH